MARGQPSFGQHTPMPPNYGMQHGMGSDSTPMSTSNLYSHVHGQPRPGNPYGGPSTPSLPAQCNINYHFGNQTPMQPSSGQRPPNAQNPSPTPPTTSLQTQQESAMIPSGYGTQQASAMTPFGYGMPHASGMMPFGFGMPPMGMPPMGMPAIGYSPQGSGLAAPSMGTTSTNQQYISRNDRLKHNDAMQQQQDQIAAPPTEGRLQQTEATRTESEQPRRKTTTLRDRMTRENASPPKPAPQSSHVVDRVEKEKRERRKKRFAQKSNLDERHRGRDLGDDTTRRDITTLQTAGDVQGSDTASTPKPSFETSQDHAPSLRTDFVGHETPWGVDRSLIPQGKHL